jgi:NAD-dependent DNA ligase/DNA polymerase/3'-5' exonuclease PolX
MSTLYNNNNIRLNEKFIELMEKLAEIMLKQGEPFRARAYQKAQETIMAFPNDIVSPDQLNGKPAIGPTIMAKLNEYVNTGTLTILEREKLNPVNILADVYGIGPKKAKDLVDNGINTIVQLRNNQDLLNKVQKIGLKYYEDVLKRIPRSEIKQYEQIFENSFKKIATPNSRFEIVGSYRRGAESSGDIDLIITSDSPKVFVTFIDELMKEKIILEILSRGPTKCLVMAKIPSSNTVRRVDFLYTSLEEFPFAILYFTGSKIFNTVMRHIALENKYTMNEHGLYHFENKNKGNKITHVFKNERDIFDFLGLVYKEPYERTDGRAIVVKNKNIVSSSSSTPINVAENIILPSKKNTKTLKKKVDLMKEKGKENYNKNKLLIIESDSESDDESDSEKAKDEEKVNFTYIISNFRKNGISVIETLNENQLSNLLREANKVYYNNSDGLLLMTDNEYDIIKEYTTNKFPNNGIIHEIGASVGSRKVKLPYFMGSMDKIKPDTEALKKWINKFNGPYVLSCKLDGVSGLYTTENNEPKLYTRGDGKIGQDISHLIPYLRLPKTKGLVIRGEFILPKSIFETKYKSKFANPRNMVAGIINNKTINKSVMSDLHFVAYELIKPDMKPSQQFEYLSSLDVEVVFNDLKTDLSNELLSDILKHLRHHYTYEMDGIIVTNDSICKRIIGNPEHSFAFKMILSDQVAEAKVVDVIWTPSKDGYLKPRVQIEPIHLGGVCIEYATGFNASFIETNKIGVGAVIEIIRSGDVIPHILNVIVKAEAAKMPSLPYKWNDTHIDVILENKELDETVNEKILTGFFRGIGVEGLSSGNIARIIQAGFDSVSKIIHMNIQDFMKVEGFKEKTASKLYNGIQDSLNNASIVSIMAASNIFGRGFSDKKIELIMESYPNILISNENKLQKINNIVSIKGMSLKTAEPFVERIPEFIQFMKNAGLESKLLVISENFVDYDESHPLFEKTIVMTGFRDAQLQDAIKKVGAKLGSTVSKNTCIVLVKDLMEDTSKAEDARNLGIPLMTPEQFKKKYLL